ncbi:MAG: amidohydrolase family protein [Burkholderiaceae bacterium]
MSRDPRRIDVHFHILPEFYRSAVLSAGRGPTSGVYPSWTPELAFELMDGNGIEVAITSISFPGVHFGDDAAASALARRCNEFAADLNAKWPRRFGAFATLPVPDVDGSLAEITYALDSLRMDGVFLLASYEGRFLGDPLFDPILQELDRRGATVFVHPGMHPSSMSVGLPWPGFMMEFLFDTTRAAVNLLFTGALERYPNIHFILSHAGGLMPYFAWRLSVAPMISPLLPRYDRATILGALRRFWYDTALSPGRQTMGCLSEVADPPRIVFGSDWPFAGGDVVKAATETLDEVGFLETERQVAIARGNALALFPRFAGN